MSEASRPVKITIVVPVYNDEEYLPRCLDSLCGQSLGEIEIICVNDASTDGSLEALRRYEAADPRLRVISFPENRRAVCARKAGVLAASGKYIMFVDSDDTLEATACAELYEKMEALDCDILNFGFHIVNCANLPERTLASFLEWGAPYPGRLEGEAFFRLAVDEEDCGGHLLWNKIYRAGPAKKAFSELEDLYLLGANDHYSWFILAYFAQSYVGIEGKYYNYYIGRGQTGHNRHELERFRALTLPQAQIAEAVGRFFAKEGVTERYADLHRTLRGKILATILLKWYALSYEDSPAGFEDVARRFAPEELMAGLTRIGWNYPERTAKKVRAARFAQPEALRSVGLYALEKLPGEQRRVMEAAARALAAQGIRVTRVYDGPGGDVSLDALRAGHRDVSAKEAYALRAEAWGRVVRERDLDALVFFTDDSPLLLWDVIAARLNGLKAAVACQGALSRFFYDRFTLKKLTQLPYTLAVADAVLAFNASDARFWGAFGRQALQLDAMDALAEPMFAATAAPVLAWYGHANAGQAALDALDIFRRVRENVPEACFNIVTEERSKGALQRLEKRVAEAGLGSAVTLRAPEDGPAEAAVVLSMGGSEGLGLDALGALRAGLPLVAVGIPAADMSAARESGAVISVDFGTRDRNGGIASDEIIELLRNEERRALLGAEGKAALEGASASDAGAMAWSEALALLAEANPGQPLDPAWDLALNKLSTWISHVTAALSKK